MRLRVPRKARRRCADGGGGGVVVVAGDRSAHRYCPSWHHCCDYGAEERSRESITERRRATWRRTDCCSPQSSDAGWLKDWERGVRRWSLAVPLRLPPVRPSACSWNSPATSPIQPPHTAPALFPHKMARAHFGLAVLFFFFFFSYFLLSTRGTGDPMCCGPQRHAPSREHNLKPEGGKEDDDVKLALQQKPDHGSALAWSDHAVIFLLLCLGGCVVLRVRWLHHIQSSSCWNKGSCCRSTTGCWLCLLVCWRLLLLLLTRPIPSAISWACVVILDKK